MSLLSVALAMALPCPAALAQNRATAVVEDAPPSLTPEALQLAIECRGSAAAMLAYAGTVFGAQPPSWLEPVDSDSHSGMLGLWTFKLAQPITVFGVRSDRISFLKDWIVVELPREQALTIIGQQNMERAPIRATEQYFHFVDDESGPMLGAFAPTDDALDVAFGRPPEPDEAHTTLFVGCNYAAVSKTQFLDAAKQADAMIGKVGGDILRMLQEEP